MKGARYRHGEWASAQECRDQDFLLHFPLQGKGIDLDHQAGRAVREPDVEHRADLAGSEGGQACDTAPRRGAIDCAWASLRVKVGFNVTLMTEIS